MRLLFVLVFVAIKAGALAISDNDTECDGDFTASTGSFASPSYSTPNAGQDNESCLWRITTAPDEKIVLNITDIDIEKIANCALGYVEIRDGHWIESPLLGRYCGHGKLNPVTSTANKMYISYVYNDRKEHRGFTANYESFCGGDIFVGDESELVSPDYPDLYPLEKKCIWKIEVHEHRKAAIRFQSFDVEEESSCSNDYVEIRDGLGEESNLIGVYCNGEPPSDIISDTNYLYVKFVSDFSVQAGGFSARIINEVDECVTSENDCSQICINTIGSFYCACKPDFELLDDGKNCVVSCGGTINTTSGKIETPSSPDVVYPLNRTCIWDIITLPENEIKINFTYFDIGGSGETCLDDNVEIFDVFIDPLSTTSTYCGNTTANETDQLANTFCGNTTPPLIFSKSNIIRIVLNSHSSIKSTGFSVDFTTNLNGCSINNGNCGHQCNSYSGTIECECPTGFVSKNTGRDCYDQNGWNFEISSSNVSIVSPNWPNDYPRNNISWWAINTTPGHKLLLTFESFILEGKCNYDNVKVYSGSRSTTLGTYCGSSVPAPVTSPDNGLYIIFKSDATNQFNGFKASYSFVCGGTFEANTTEKFIYSHVDFGYSNYTDGTNCEWVITADSNYTITLSFLSFKLEDFDQCEFDYVEVFDGANFTGPSFGKYCGYETPPRFCSTNNSLSIRFRANDANSDRGFSLIYKAIKIFD